MSEQEILLKKIQDEVGVLVENKLNASMTQIKSLEDKVNALSNYDDSVLKEEVVKMSALIEALKESKVEKTAKNSLKEEIEKHKDNLTSIKQGDRSKGFVIKAVDDMSLAGNVTGQVPQAQRIPGLNAIAQRQVRFLDVLQRGAASSNLIEWVYQANKDGTAGQTEEGALKNQIDFDILVASQKVEKTTAYIRVTDEMLADVDFIETAIRTELFTELLKSVESGAYSGNGVSPALNGVYTVAPTFSAGSLAATVDNANEVDVLAVAMNQIMLSEQGMPNFIFMHPTDVTRLKMVKVSSSDKRYVERLAMVAGELSLDGVAIIPTTLVAVGTFLIGDFSKAFLYEKQAPSIEIGLNADDFVKNFKTIRAEWRGAVVVKNNDRTAFVKGTFATAKAALETT